MRRGLTSAPPTASRGSIDLAAVDAIDAERRGHGEIAGAAVEFVEAAMRVGGSSGSRASTKSSSSASAVVMMPLKKSRAAMTRSPRALLAKTSPSSAASTRHHSDAGSACASEPQKVPRLRIG